jgi:hypothetical protein
MSGKEVKLDALGQKAEKALMSMLDEVTKPQGAATPPEERITMLEKMRVIDRVLKWQAIKLKAEDDEGGFFNFGAGEDSDDSEEPVKGAVKRGTVTKSPR